MDCLPSLEFACERGDIYFALRKPSTNHRLFNGQVSSWDVARVNRVIVIKG